MANITSEGIDSVITTVLKLEGDDFNVRDDINLKQKQELISWTLKSSKEVLTILKTLVVYDYGPHKEKTVLDLIIHCVDDNDTIFELLDNWKFKDAIRNIGKEHELKDLQSAIYIAVDKKSVEEYGATDKGTTMAFMIRGKILGSDLLGTVRFTMEEADELLMMRNPYNAFYLMDGLINNKTELGRWNEGPKKKILIFNNNESDIIKKIKAWRRKFYTDILNDQGEEDSDVI
jgi:hypothetical protein